jgi:hypothetical protein
MELNWSEIWLLLLKNLDNQPKCPDHPNHPMVKTLSLGVINDIVHSDQERIILRSHRTGKEDPLKASHFKIWWNFLTEHGKASMKPGDPNNPSAYRSCIIGSIFVKCLPELIEQTSSDKSIIQLTLKPRT